MAKKKHKKSSCKKATTEKVLLATAITQLVIAIINLIDTLTS